MLQKINEFLKFLYYVLFIISLPLITALVAGISSFIQTGDFFNYISLIPVYIWIIICIFPVIYLIIKRRQDVIKSDNYFPDIMYIVSDNHQAELANSVGIKPIGTITYDNVIWEVYMPEYDYFMNPFTKENRHEQTIIKIPPLCPICKTELDQSIAFFGGYLWKCHSCNYSTKKKQQYQYLARKALKVGKKLVKDDIENKK